MKIALNELSCIKCLHRWFPRKKEVRQCPKCKTAYFDKPRNG